MVYSRATWRTQGRMPHAPRTVPTGASRRRSAPQARAAQMGTWKLAYADFLTALAAFFLIMWLVKGMPESGRADLATYFETGAPPSAPMADREHPDATTHLAAALQTAPALLAHGDHIEIVEAQDGLRIDMIDRSRVSLFETGSAQPTAHGASVMADMFATLSALPYPMSVEGHTDAFAYADGEADNWTLSTARAHSARQIAEQSGIAPAHFQAVTGYGDRRPRLPREPHHPSNRRVSVILHVPTNDRIPGGA